MTLKQLEAFYWAATCANFAVAAQRLNLSTSSLSKRIAELEVSLGTSLFDRSGNRAILTTAGNDLLGKALGLLDHAVEVRSTISGTGTNLSGHVTFGVGDLSAMTWLPGFIAAVKERHPGLVIETIVDVGAGLEGRLERGELDFAVVAGRSSRHRIISLPIAEASFAWVAAPELVGDNCTSAMLVDQKMPLVVLPATAGSTSLIDDWLTRNHIIHTERVVCNNWAAIVGMLTLSVGVGIVPINWADQLEQKGQLRRLKSEHRLAPLAYSFQCRRGDTRPLIVEMQRLIAALADFTKSFGFI